MAKKMVNQDFQPYPREDGQVLAKGDLFPKPDVSLSLAKIGSAIDAAFDRAMRNKKGEIKPVADTPEKLVDNCILHLKERSDPILSPAFVSQLAPEDIFDLDAVSHEMQRHRMTIGVFYQFLLLELMKARGWVVFDGVNEGDIVADVETPGFNSGLRLYISVKKSSDTVGGQDVPGVVRRLESLAKGEKNLTRPYLCVLCVATPTRGKLLDYEEDRKVKRNRDGHYLSLNCEIWGPGFVFPYVSGREAQDIYVAAFKRVAKYLPFRTLQFRAQCATLLKKKLAALELIDTNGRIDAERFLQFISQSKRARVR